MPPNLSSFGQRVTGLVKSVSAMGAFPFAGEDDSEADASVPLAA